MHATCKPNGWAALGAAVICLSGAAGAGCTYGSSCEYLLTCDTGTGGGAGGGGAGGTTSPGGTGGGTTTGGSGGTGGMPELCGNGTRDPGEQCDDDNTVDGDGCDSNCTPTGCGNGVQTTGEQCDDGNMVDGDGCDQGCIDSACGNGIVAPNEECDDGNSTALDGCGPSCVIEEGWECDDNAPTTCMKSCLDGTLDPGEQCDVGGDVSGDGCNADCTAVADWFCSNPDGDDKPSVCVAQSCKAILNVNPGAPTGIYEVDPDGMAQNAPIQVYCDMVRDGGGWALVLQNNVAVVSPNPNLNDVVNVVTVTGTFGADLSKFDLFLGLRHWGLLGTQMRIDVGVNPTDQTKTAIYAFTVKPVTYALQFGAGGVTKGNSMDEPDIKLYSGDGTIGITTTDHDVDTDGAKNCANEHGYAWWYKACWKGSLWGSNFGMGLTPEAYWAGVGADHYPYGALWVK